MPSQYSRPPTGLQLRPFRAVRYNSSTDLSALICPPYDTIGPAHATALCRRPHHLARLLYAQNPHTAAQSLDRWLRRGLLRRDPHPGLYVYRQQVGDRIIQQGVIGELLLPRTSPGPVLPHEDVQPHVVEQRATHMAALRAQLEPLLLTYRSERATVAEVIDRVTSRTPAAFARLGSTTHTLWACTSPGEQDAITTAVSGSRALIADGHHRHAACLRLGEPEGAGPWEHCLALLVDSARHPLQLTAIHRVIPGLEPHKAAAAAADVARVRPLYDGPRPPAPGELVLTGAARAWSITHPEPRALSEALAGESPRWRRLPAAVADHLLLEHAWQVTNLPGAVRHAHAAEQAVAATAAPGRGTTLLLPALTEDTVVDLAAAGVLLPRKSTSFGPKPAAGLALRVLESP